MFRAGDMSSHVYDGDALAFFGFGFGRGRWNGESDVTRQRQDNKQDPPLLVPHREQSSVRSFHGRGPHRTLGLGAHHPPTPTKTKTNALLLIRAPPTQKSHTYKHHTSTHTYTCTSCPFPAQPFLHPILPYSVYMSLS